MPRYFFDTSDGTSQLIDRTGLVYADARGAREQALHALSDMAQDQIPRGGERLLSIVVRDDVGDRVYSATLALSEDQPLPS